MNFVDNNVCVLQNFVSVASLGDQKCGAAVGAALLAAAASHCSAITDGPVFHRAKKVDRKKNSTNKWMPIPDDYWLQYCFQMN